MKAHLPRSLLWRTFLILAGLSLATTLAWVQIFRVFETAPRLQQLAEHLVSAVNLTRTAMITADVNKRRDLLLNLAEREGIEVYPAEVDDSISLPPASDHDLQRVLMLARQSLGADTRFAIERAGQTGFWVSFRIGEEDEYWARMPIDRFQQQLTLQWLGWGLLALLLALVAAFFIARRLGLPLQALSDAAKNIGRGQSGVSVPETGPLEIRNLSLAFNHMSQELTRLDQDRALILAGVSHDLRTPLARLRLAVEMSSDTSLRSGMAQDIEEMDRIIGQFLDFARYANAANPDATARAPTMLRLSDIAQHMLEHYRKSGHQLSADLQPTPLQPLHELALQRVLSNLIDNAIRHAAGSAILLRTRKARPSESTQEAVVMEVIDAGPGIDAGLRERLKLPFVRAQDSRTGPAGSGLGLAIVERILRQYGGTLALLPRPAGEGSGLVARVTLPIAATAAPA